VDLLIEFPRSYQGWFRRDKSKPIRFGIATHIEGFESCLFDLGLLYLGLNLKPRFVLPLKLPNHLYCSDYCH
jgi:hypothetical protein